MLAVVAEKLAPEIAASQQSPIVVFEFMDASDVSTELGQNLADELSARFAAANQGIAVLDRALVNKFLDTNGLPPSTITSYLAGKWAAKSVGAKAFAMGKLSVHRDKLTVEISVYGAETGKRIDGYKLNVPMTPILEKKLANKISWETSIDGRTVHLGGVDNYSRSACLYCPGPNFGSSEAAKKIVEGTVLLSIVVGDDGRAHDIVVIQETSSGLTEKAVEAVSRWKFNPSKGPDGKRASVRQMIEVEVHFRP